MLGAPNTGVDIAISRDGSRIVYRGPNGTEGGAGAQLWERSLSDLVPRAIPGTIGAMYPTLSRDGGTVVFSGSGLSLHAKPLSGGPSVELVTGATNAAFDEDGIVYYRVEGSGVIWRVPVSGGKGQPFTTPYEGADLRYPDPLPGGRGLLVTISRGNLARSSIGVVGPAGGQVRELFAGAMARYSESGHIVYTTADGSMMAAPFDARTLEVTGTPVLVLEGVAVKGTSASQFALSGNGSLIYQTGAAGDSELEIVVLDLDGNEAPLGPSPRDVAAVSWSPDGNSVVFASEGHVYTYDAARRTPPRRVTFEGTNNNPVFSPDGRFVAYDSERDGTDGRDVFVKSLVDDSPAKAVVTLASNQSVTQWPSDSLIVFESGAAGNRALWTVDLSDPENPQTRAYLSTEADLRLMVVSPDGTLAAYSSNESGRWEVHLRSFPDPGVPTIVSRGEGSSVHVPFWSPSGDTVFYFEGPGAPLVAARLQRNPGPVVVSSDTLVATISSARPFQEAGLHPEGRRFVLARTVGTSVTRGATEAANPVLVLNFDQELRRLMPN